MVFSSIVCMLNTSRNIFKGHISGVKRMENNFELLRNKPIIQVLDGDTPL